MKWKKLLAVLGTSAFMLTAAAMGEILPYRGFSVPLYADAAEHTYGVSNQKAAICIGRAEVTLEELKASNYQVPILVKMKPNPGVTELEFGLKSTIPYTILDPDDLDPDDSAYKAVDQLATAPSDLSLTIKMTTVTGSYEGEFYSWLAWANSKKITKPNFAVLLMEVPTTAKAGDQYPISFLYRGLSGQLAICGLNVDGEKMDYLENYDFEAMDGYIKIVSSASQQESTTPTETQKPTQTTETTKTTATTATTKATATTETTKATATTATTKATATTATTETTVTTDTTPTTPASNTTFTESINNWSFANSSKNFGSYYYISDSYQKKLLSGLSRAEQYAIKDILSGEFEGSCYGMASTSILSCYNKNFPASYQPGATFLHDIAGPPTKDVQSLINYYFALQATDYVGQYNVWALYCSTEKDKITKLLDELKDDSPTLLTFILGDSNGGHAVVAYDVEYGSFVKKGKSYNAKVVTYDNNAVNYNDDFCMYINTSSSSWIIPAYYEFGGSTDFGATIGLTTDSLDIINYHGYLDGTSGLAIEEFIPVFSSKAIQSDYSLRRINLTGGKWTINAGSDDDIVAFSSFTDDFSASDVKFAIRGTKKGCAMQLEQKEDVDMSMRYPNDLLEVSFAKADTVVFDPSGYAEVSGDSSAYDVSFVSNDGYAPTDWYQVSVSGNAGSVKFYKAESGYILNADSLKNVKVTAYSDNANPSLMFSADQSEVFIYEIDENTIGVSIDTDGDGKFETPVEPTGSTPGDVDGNGSVNILDVVAVNKYIIGSKTLDAVQFSAADVNKDGEVNSTDSLLILKYALEIIKSF